MPNRSSEIGALKRGAMRFAVLLTGAVAALSLDSGSGAVAQSIYDARVEHRIKFTAQQRPQVLRILEQSKRQAMAVFKKYGIDPNGTPIFDQLVKASSELSAISSQERRAMKAVLNDQQMAEYIRIIEDTHTRVRMAAQAAGQ